MRYVLDTNTLAAVMKGDRVVVQRLLSTDSTEVGLPQPVVAEILCGITRLPSSRAKTRLKRRWLVISSELARIPWSDEVSQQFGRIKTSLERRGQIIEDFDIAIAAHAAAHRATLVTSDLGHMGRVQGLRLEDWTVST
jgi:tRNA(fMet)-specific endonuclease VapC